MDPTVVRHRRSPSSDRFLDVFSFSPPSTASAFSIADEFNEAEVFFTNDFTAPDNHHHRRHRPPDLPRHQNHARRASFPHPPNAGILAALAGPEPRAHSQPSRDPPVLYRKPSISSPKSIPSIPRTPQARDYTQSSPARKIPQSAPMNVPVPSREAMRQRVKDFAAVDDGEAEDEEMLPPHEIVARGWCRSPKTTCSVLEGAGRTLKGRDLRQVRNAVWRQTGFLD